MLQGDRSPVASDSVVVPRELREQLLWTEAPKEVMQMVPSGG